MSGGVVDGRGTKRANGPKSLSVTPASRLGHGRDGEGAGEFEALHAEVAKLARKVDQLAEVDAIMRGSMRRTGPEKLRSAGWHAAPVTCRQSSGQRWCCYPRAAHDLNRQRIRR